MKKLLLTSLLVIIPVIAFGQDTKATIYVYALTASSTIGTVKKSVYLDGKEIAQIRPERFFIAAVEAGRHTMHFQNKKFGGVEMDFQAGTVYYLRIGWKVGLSIKPNGITVMPAESGAFEIKQLKTVDKGQVKDTDIVRLSL